MAFPTRRSNLEMKAESRFSSRIARWADQRNHESQTLTRVLKGLARVLIITAREFKKNSLFIRSGALTFAILLSLVPMLAMSTALYKGLGGGDHLKMAAYRYITNLETNHLKTFSQDLTTSSAPSTELQENTSPSPSSSLTTHLRSAVDKLFDYVEKINFATLGIYGMVGLFIGVLLVFDNMESAMNSIWHVQRGRSIIRKIADYLALLLMMPLSVNIGLAAVAFQKNSSLFSYFQNAVPFLWLQALLLHLFPILCIILTFYVLYIFFPNTKVHTIPALIGAGLASVSWIALQNIYLNLQIGVASYNAIYGSFATLPLFLTWMYFGVVCVLAGGQFAFACQNYEKYSLACRSGAISQRLAIGLEVMEKVQNAFSFQQKLSYMQVAEHFPHLDHPVLSEVIDDLIATGLLHASEGTGLLFPSGDNNTLSRQYILSRLLEAARISDGQTEDLASATVPPAAPIVP